MYGIVKRGNVKGCIKKWVKRNLITSQKKGSPKPETKYQRGQDKKNQSEMKNKVMISEREENKSSCQV